MCVGLSGQRKLEMEGRQMLEVKMQVEYMSFSAHADAKGIMQLVGQAEPESVLLVHGEAKKMEFLRQKIEQEFRVSCYMPANGETVTLPTSPSIPVGISLGLLKREMAQGLLLPEAKKPRLLHGTLIMKDNVSINSGGVGWGLHPLLSVTGLPLPLRISGWCPRSRPSRSWAWLNTSCVSPVVCTCRTHAKNKKQPYVCTAISRAPSRTTVYSISRMVL